MLPACALVLDCCATRREYPTTRSYGDQSMTMMGMAGSTDAAEFASPAAQSGKANSAYRWISRPEVRIRSPQLSWTSDARGMDIS